MEVAVTVGITAKEFVEKFKPAVRAAEEALGTAALLPVDGTITVELYGEANGPQDPEITKLVISNDDMERAEVKGKVFFDWEEL